jgi:hypothetical protein
MSNLPKKRLSKQEVKKILPIVKEFNKLSKSFLKLIGQKIDHKEKEVRRIAVMVRGISKPVAPQHSTVNIRTVDLKKSFIKRATGFFSSEKEQKKKITWEEDIKRKRGGIIL